MADKDENRRIIEAKSRISRFTFENSHLIKQIEGLKKEINTVEANKERLIVQLEDSNKISAKENEQDAQDGSESESLVSSNPVSTTSLSDFSDTSSNVSSTASQYCVDPELLRRQRSLETTLSSDLRRGAFAKNESGLRPVPNIPDNLDFEAITWLQKFIQNLNDIKSCFSSDRCENYQLLDTKFAALQELAYNRMESLIKSNGESDPTNITSTASGNSILPPDVLQAGVKQTQPQSGNTSTRQVLSLNYFLKFLSFPFIFLLGCGYVGLLMYAKQVDSCFISPPQ